MAVKADLKILKADEDAAAAAAAAAASESGGAAAVAKPKWNGSAAQRLLKVDIDDGKHDQLKPKELYATRIEYRVFLLDDFRKRLYEETSSRLQKSYWLAKKAAKKKEMEKARNNTDW